MKRSDISDEHVIELAQAWVDNPEGPGVIEALMLEGVPEKLAYSKVDHMCDRDLLEYGVSPRYAWPQTTLRLLK